MELEFCLREIVSMSEGVFNPAYRQAGAESAEEYGLLRYSWRHIVLTASILI
jgi:hypothetical protein